MCTNAIRVPVKDLTCVEDIAPESGRAFGEEVLGTRGLRVEVDAVDGGILRVGSVCRFESESFPVGALTLCLDGAGATLLTADTSVTPDDEATFAGRSVPAGLEHADAMSRIDRLTALRMVRVLHQ